MLGPFKRRPVRKAPPGPNEPSLRRLQKDVDRITNQLHSLGRRVGEMAALLTSQHEDLLEQLRPEAASDRAPLPSLPVTLSKIGKRKPVVVGPWRGEVGWELLYWIPFLRWLTEHGLSAERTVAISRGGARSWYRGLAERYVDLSELPEQWRTRSQSDSSQKQRIIDPHDVAAVRHVANDGEVGRFVHLHPSLMYRMLQPYWTGNAPSSYLHQLTEVARLTAPSVPPDVQLPDRFVVVKLYDSRAFRLREKSVGWAHGMIGALARDIDVVVLNPAEAVDDHPALQIEASPRIHVMDPTRWKDNLDVQTAIVARAAGLVATYGGFSYLGPLVGVPTVAVYANADAVLGHHLELAGEMFDRLAPGLYTALHLDHFQMLRLSFK